MLKKKQLDEAVLELFSPRLREILSRLATAERRDSIQELVWLIEATASGRLRDMGDAPASPRVRMDDLPEVHYPEKISVTRVQPQVGDVSIRPAHDSSDT